MRIMGETPGAVPQTASTGSHMSIETASSADLIFSGKILNLGPRIIGPPNISVYGFISVTVLETYKGASDPQLTVAARTKFTGKSFLERIPSINSTYIFFVKRNNGDNIVLKLIPTNNENIAKTKAVIAAAPASK
jgi:hypothetical protein